MFYTQGDIASRAVRGLGERQFCWGLAWKHLHVKLYTGPLEWHKQEALRHRLAAGGARRETVFRECYNVWRCASHVSQLTRKLLCTVVVRGCSVILLFSLTFGRFYKVRPVDAPAAASPTFQGQRRAATCSFGARGGRAANPMQTAVDETDKNVIWTC